MLDRATARHIVSSATLNVLGQAAPGIAALFAVPQVVAALGVGRFGILALAWAAVAYAGIFDLGTGRALTQALSSRVSASDLVRGRLVGSAFAVTFGFGIIAGTLVWMVASPLATLLTRDAPNLAAEVTRTVRIMAWLVPLAVLTPTVRGLLEASQRFAAINAVAIPANLATYIVPAVVVRLEPTLPAVIVGLLAVRLCFVMMLGILALARERALATMRVGRAEIAMLLSFGGWATISNVVSPLILQLDRVLLGTVGSLTALGHYALPAEVIARARVIPGAITQVLFPSFSEALATNEARALELLESALKAIGAVMFAGTLVLVAAAPEALRLWLGNEVADQTTGVARILAVSLLVNGVAFPAFAFIQAAAQPRATAFIHLVELPVHVAIAWLLIARFGAMGAAAATLVRHVVDTGAMLWMSRRLVSPEVHTGRRRFAAILAAIVALGGASLPVAFGPRVLIAAALGVGVAWVGWRFMLNHREREWCRASFGRVLGVRKASA